MSLQLRSRKHPIVILFDLQKPPCSVGTVCQESWREPGEKTAEGVEEKIGKQVIFSKSQGARDGTLLWSKQSCRGDNTC